MATLNLMGLKISTESISHDGLHEDGQFHTHDMSFVCIEQSHHESTVRSPVQWRVTVVRGESCLREEDEELNWLIEDGQRAIFMYMKRGISADIQRDIRCDIDRDIVRRYLIQLGRLAENPHDSNMLSWWGNSSLLSGSI
ncbi:hypothetical protein CC78DRAFT_582863 [Lojkania enalia]|uniref:Uncharacterized protein n=1 Tax=Lojkania enalia TaxID=147567 RepID=A0A9P4K6F0_9PLEO|nr:hypothetical protein CC78DRAFT_582863 [Didymosphaeria enalia]